MKKILTLVFFFSTLIISAQNVGINSTGSAPDGSAMLDVSSTTSGILIPRMTQTNRNNISTPATGLMIFQTDNTPGFYYNAGTPASPNWTQVGGTSGSGSGTNNYVARWTPDGSTLGIGVIQDNGTRVGIGGSPVSSSILALNSTTNGFLPPRMTEAQREAISSPQDGLIVYQSNDATEMDEGLQIYEDGSWSTVITSIETNNGWNNNDMYRIPRFSADRNNIEGSQIIDRFGLVNIGNETPHDCNVRVDILNSDNNVACDMTPPYKAFRVEQAMAGSPESWAAIFKNTTPSNNLSPAQQNKNGVEIQVTGGGSNTPAQYALKTTTSGDAINNYGASVNVSGATGSNTAGYFSASDGSSTYGGNFSASNAIVNYAGNFTASGGTNSYGGNFSATGASNGYGIASNANGNTGYNYGAHLTASGGSHNWAIWATTNTATDPTIQAGTHGAYIEGDLWVNKIRGVAANTALTNEDFFVWVSAACTITLPNATGLDGKILYVRSIHGGTTNISSASWVYRENIAPAHNFALGAYGGLRLIANGDSWFSL